MKRFLTFCLIFFFCEVSLFPCTFWGCIGTNVSNGGLLIAKNRDSDEDSRTIVKVIFPEGGFKYLAMYADGEDGGVKGGINEKGLVVYTATASSVKTEDRFSEGKSKCRMILSECITVDDVIKNQDKYLLGRTQFLIIGDNKELACIEISPDNKINIVRISNGSLYHTNHYLANDFLTYNEKIGKSSLTRCNRISELLDSQSPKSLEDMIAISEDKNDGGDNSIWRDGSPGSSTRTLMNMSIYVPADGAPRVSVKLKNKGEQEIRGELTLDKIFWQQEGIIQIR
jgi:isopenicillin-N N-acyltransferase like protein